MTDLPDDNWGDESTDNRYINDKPIQIQHVMETDGWIYRIAIIGIVVFALASLAAIVYLTDQGKTSEAITAVLGTAVGGLAGVFVRKKD